MTELNDAMVEAAVPHIKDLLRMAGRDGVLVAAQNVTAFTSRALTAAIAIQPEAERAKIIEQKFIGLIELEQKSIIEAALAALSRPAPAAEVTGERKEVTLFQAIAHWDEIHRAWLKQAIADHFAGRPVEPVRPSPDAGRVPEGLFSAVQEWRDARFDLCACKINTPESTVAFTRLGKAEDALCRLAVSLAHDEVKS